MKNLHIKRTRAGILGGLLAATMILLPAARSDAAKTTGPVITSFSPTQGWSTGGDDTNVVITGTGLKNTTAVMFGSVPAKSFTLVSDTEVDATTAPQPASLVHISVTTGTGRTAKSTTSSGWFEYREDVDPTDPCVNIADGQGPSISPTFEFHGSIAVTNGPLCPQATYTWVIKTPDGRPLTWVTDSSSGKTNCTTVETPTGLDTISVACTGSSATAFDLYGFFSVSTASQQLLVRAELTNPLTGQSDRWPEATQGDFMPVCGSGSTGCGFGMT